MACQKWISVLPWARAGSAPAASAKVAASAQAAVRVNSTRRMANLRCRLGLGRAAARAGRGGGSGPRAGQASPMGVSPRSRRSDVLVAPDRARPTIPRFRRRAGGPARRHARGLCLAEAAAAVDQLDVRVELGVEAAAGPARAARAMRAAMASAQSRPWQRLWPMPVRRSSTSCSDTAISSRDGVVELGHDLRVARAEPLRSRRAASAPARARARSRARRSPPAS